MSFRSHRRLLRMSLLLTGIAGACSLQVPSEKEIFSDAKSTGGKSSGGGSNKGGADVGGADQGGSSASGGAGGSTTTAGAGVITGGVANAGATNGGATNGGSPNGGAAPVGGSPNGGSGGGSSSDVGGSSNGGASAGGADNSGGLGGGHAGGAAGASSTVATGGAPDPFAPGMVAHFKFDETSGLAAVNSVDPSKSGTLMGLATRVSGRYGRAVRIRNDKVTTDYVDLPAGLLTGLSATTISIWVHNQSTQRPEARAFDFGTGTGSNFFVSPHAVDPATTKQGASLGGVSGGLTFVNVWSFAIDYTQPTQVWHMFTTTWDATAIKFYVDGVLSATKDSPTVLPSAISPSPNWLGKTFDDAKIIMYAHFDDMRIWDRVLTDAEVLGLFQVL